MGFAAAFPNGFGRIRSLSARGFLFALCLLCPLPAAGPGWGTEEPSWKGTYYEMDSAEQFSTFRDWVNKGTSADETYRITKDIDLGGSDWIPIGAIFSDDHYFTGVLSGDGKTVSNFRIVSSDYAYEFAGLFGILSGDVRISGLRVTSFDIAAGRGGSRGGSFAKALLKEAVSAFALLELSSPSDAEAAVRAVKDLFAGGLAGGMGGRASLVSCDVSGSVSGIASEPPAPHVFIIDLGSGKIPVTLPGGSFVLAGGLVGGQAGGSIEAVSAAGRVSGSAVGSGDLSLALAGGLLGGQMGGSVTNACAVNAVSVSKNADEPFAAAGGFAGGQVGGSITNAFAAGSVSGTGTGKKNFIAGGFIGVASANPDLSGLPFPIDLAFGGKALIENAYAAGSVSVPAGGTDRAAAGGFVGYRIYNGKDSAGKIKNSCATGRVDGPRGNAASQTGAGGFIGYNTSNISEVTGSVFDTQGTGQKPYKGEGWELTDPNGGLPAIRALSNAEMTIGNVSGLGADWLSEPGYYPELAALAGAFPEASGFAAVPVLFVSPDTSRSVTRALRVPKTTRQGADVSLDVKFEVPTGTGTVLEFGEDGGYWRLTPITSGEAELTVRVGARAKTFPLTLAASGDVPPLPSEKDYDIGLSPAGTCVFPARIVGYSS
ncbi:MAG: hypothetical protein LBO82_06705, partial [Synergistaceae bacterium]|nr:hypothetical protein [Synergistaceae bacterium]